MLIGCEPPITHEALPAPANDMAVLTHPGINDFIVNLAAKWTLHESSPFSALIALLDE
jgi:hypothetical protein